MKIAFFIPGQSKDERTLGSREEKVDRRLKTVDTGTEPEVMAKQFYQIG